MERKIKTVILDFGGVIITSCQKEAMRRLAEIGVGPEVMTLDNYAQTGLIGALEEGKIGEEEFRRALSEKIGKELTFEDLKWVITGYAKEVPERNLRLLRQLRQEGYRLLLLSNTNQYMMAWAMSEEFDGMGGTLSDYFDHCYLSYQMGLAKPDPEIFREVLRQENLDPQTAIFVDDNDTNIRTASQLGLHTLMPVNGEDWTQDLKRALYKNEV
ncbi:MAG: HAD family phosphatase [Prevotella sp.]|nr:HAD family phosphatase [Prevotella sp.]